MRKTIADLDMAVWRARELSADAIHSSFVECLEDDGRKSGSFATEGASVCKRT
jgi:hypothetical protein